MKQGLSIIVTIRGDEPQTANTCMNAKEKAGCPVEIIAVYDGTPYDPDLQSYADKILEHRTARGIGQSRHKGINAARYSVVMLIDAHMDFEEGFGQKILDHFRKKKHYKDVACGRCVPSMLDLSPIRDDDGSVSHGYTAARFSIRSEETGGEKWCLSGKWSEQEVETEIGCVFGACYAFRKKWYEEIGEPLNLLSGWWGDEEYLSIASWLAGGRCYLIDFWASHLFRDRPSFTWTKAERMAPSVNRSRLVDLFPASDDMNENFRAWLELSISAADRDYLTAYDANRVRPEVIEAKKLWKTWTKNVDSFLDRWVDDEAQPLNVRTQMREEARPWKQEQSTMVLPPVDVPRVQQRKVIVCPNCGHGNSFRVKSTQRINGELRRYGRCGNLVCKNKAVMIDRGSEQVIYWGKDASRI